MWGADWKFCHNENCLAPRGLRSDAEQLSRVKDVFIAKLRNVLGIEIGAEAASGSLHWETSALNTGLLLFDEIKYMTIVPILSTPFTALLVECVMLYSWNVKNHFKQLLSKDST